MWQFFKLQLVGCSKFIAKHRCYWLTSKFCSIFFSVQIIVIVFIDLGLCVNPTIFVTLVGFKSKQTYFDTMTFNEKHAPVDGKLGIYWFCLNSQLDFEKIVNWQVKM